MERAMQVRRTDVARKGESEGGEVTGNDAEGHFGSERRKVTHNQIVDSEAFT